MKYNKHILTITMFIVIVFLFVGCLMPPQTKGIIEGRVLVPPVAMGISRDVSGWVPIAGAEVTVIDANGITHTVYTDEDGYYSFENIAVNPNTVVTATVEVNGNTVVLKAVIPDAVAEDENYDAGTMDPESTALALVVEELIDEGVAQEDIDLDEIKDSDYFEDLVEQVTTIIEEGSDVTDDSDVDDSVGNITDEYNATTTELEAINVYGTPVVGERLSITISPSGATASAQWQRASTESGSFTNISGATGGSYTLKAADEGKWIRIAATGTGDYTGTVTSDAKGPVEFPATLSIVEPDDSIVGTPGYTRFAGSIDVSDNVESGDYNAYYIFEITDGTIEGVPQYWDKNDTTWKDLFDNGNDEYIFGDPTDGFDLVDVDGATTEFQIKIDGESITGKAYLVDADDDTKVLSNVLEETITSDAEKGVYNKNTDKYFDGIQAAIDDDATSDDDEIIVYPGEYNKETIIIDKGITLTGDGIDSSIINGSIIIAYVDVKYSPRSGEILASRASPPAISGVTISGFTIEGSGEDEGIGIALMGASECAIQGNKIKNINGPGMVLALSNDSDIIDNYIEDNELWGLALAASCGNNIEGNYFSGNAADTIALDNGSEISSELKEIGSTGNTFDGNTIEDGVKCGFYLGVNCDGNYITGNEISGINDTDDAIAIFLHFSSENTLTGNTITGNSNGIKIRSSSNNNVSDNTVSNNTVKGIEVSCNEGGSVASKGNLINKNIITGNSFGLDASENNGNDVTEAPVVDATLNWWGDASGPTHSSNYDGSGDEVSDYVDFSPWWADENMTEQGVREISITPETKSRIAVNKTIAITAEGADDLRIMLWPSEITSIEDARDSYADKVFSSRLDDLSSGGMNIEKSDGAFTITINQTLIEMLEAGTQYSDGGVSSTGNYTWSAGGATTWIFTPETNGLLWSEYNTWDSYAVDDTLFIYYLETSEL
jgi:parallel beta-helix repeat protein